MVFRILCFLYSLLGIDAKRERNCKIVNTKSVLTFEKLVIFCKNVKWLNGWCHYKIFFDLMIKYITHSQIDKQKWDHCIKNSPVFLPYTYSWYLDIVSPGWEALIRGDYEFIMPLTGSRKFGINYVFPPTYCQQLGVIPAHEKNQFEIDDFICSIPDKYSYISIFLNRNNIITNPSLVDKIHYGTNYVLNMNESYQTISKHYSENTIRNIKKAIKREIEFTDKPISALEWSQHKIEMIYEKKIQLRKKYAYRIADLINLENKEKQNLFYTAYNHSNNIISGLLVMIISKTAMIFSFSKKEGKESRAYFMLLDKFIKEYAGKINTLDFMGSNIPGIAYTNEGFGGVPVKYPVIEINRLPRWVNFFRRMTKKSR